MFGATILFSYYKNYFYSESTIFINRKFMKFMFFTKNKILTFTIFINKKFMFSY